MNTNTDKPLTNNYVLTQITSRILNAKEFIKEENNAKYWQARLDELESLECVLRAAMYQAPKTPQLDTKGNRI